MSHDERVVIRRRIANPKVANPLTGGVVGGFGGMIATAGISGGYDWVVGAGLVGGAMIAGAATYVWSSLKITEEESFLASLTDEELRIEAIQRGHAHLVPKHRE